MVPQNGWFIMKHPIKNGWFGGKTHHFRKHPYIPWVPTVWALVSLAQPGELGKRKQLWHLPECASHGFNQQWCAWCRWTCPPFGWWEPEAKTPEDERLEPKNPPNWNPGTHLPNHHFWVQNVNFPGCRCEKKKVFLGCPRKLVKRFGLVGYNPNTSHL